MQVLENLMYLGPNRRSEKHTVIEWRLALTAGELATFQAALADGLPAVRQELARLDINLSREHFAALPVDAQEGQQIILRLAGLIAALAIALQRAAGHRVAYTATLPQEDSMHARVLYEYEHGGTGDEAGEIVMRLLSETLPGLAWDVDNDVPGDGFSAGLTSFLERAPRFVLPPDAQAIIDAAARLDVPCVKLEREPYGEFPGDFRIRNNGLLKLGHACYHTIVDGTLCLDRNAPLVPLLFDREKLFFKMRALKLPVPDQDPEIRNIVTSRRAIFAAQRIGFPVVLKPLLRNRSGKAAASVQAIGSPEELQQAFAKAAATQQKFLVEKFVQGASFRVLLANHEVVCSVTATPGQVLETPLHPSILDVCTRVSRTLDCGMVCLTLVTRDPLRPLADTGGAIVDLDFAPRLDELLPPGSVFMDRAAEGFVKWLYPAGKPSRIPLVAVTGTNGKTTTSRMVNRIARHAGYSPGMASTSGIYLNEGLHESGDQAGSGGHHTVFESRDINLAVLETARGAVAHSGFMYDWCDVAVCLNVTPDHLNQYDINSLAQMAGIKRSVLQRARHAVVLNADYETCRQMLPFGRGRKVYLAALESRLQDIRDLAGEAAYICITEKEAGSDWIVLYEPGGKRVPVMPVAEIPATLDGKVAFNLSNAQHAVCASHALGIEIKYIRSGLASFEASYENTPGRLNIYRDLPFTVIMDYAHNLDGMNKLGAVIDQLPVSGRKILLFAAAAHRKDEETADVVRTAARYFDYFVCRCYPGRRCAERPETPTLMKNTLLASGVPEDRITLVSVPEEGTGQALRMGRPGDLVVLCPGTNEMQDMWQEVTAFRPEWLD